MAYGTVKVDNITFDNGGVDQNIQVKDLFESTTSGLTVTGTISGQRIEAVSGVITTVSGTNLTYTTAGVQNISGGTLNYSSGIFASGTQTNPSIAFSGDVDTGFYNPTPNQIGITTAGGERVRIQDDGDVGIGTTNPVAKLHVAENSSAPGVLITQAGAGTALTVSGASVFSSTVTATTFSGNVVGNLTGTASAIADNTVTSAKIVDGTIVNADVNASAAIAGTKISPNFGSQNVVTTGTSTAASLIPTGSSVPTNGVYLPAANSVGISTNGAGRLFVDSTGKVSLTGDIEFSRTSPASLTVDASGNVRIAADTANTSAASAVNFNVDGLEACDINNSGFLRFNKAAFTGGGVCTQQLDSVLNLGGGTNTLNSGLNISLSGPDRVSDIGILMRWNTTVLYQWQKTSDFHNWNTGGTERMRLDSTGRFDVKGAGTAGVSPAFSINGSAPSNSAVVDSNGRLGLGTSSPLSLLTLGTTTPRLEFDDSDSAADNRRWTLATSGTELTLQALTDAGVGGGNLFRFSRSGNQIQSFQGFQAGNPWFHVDNSTQRVGIGTTSPNESLEVAGNIHVSGADRSIFNRSNNALTFGTNNTERARIDSSGRLLVGTFSARTAVFYNGDANTNPRLQIEAAGTAGTSANGAVSITRVNDTAGAQPYLLLARARGTALGSTSLVSSGDGIGGLTFQAADGTDFVEAASVIAQVDGTPGANDMPGRLVFSVTLAGAASPTEAFRITNDRVRAYNQAAPAAVNATATLTVANIKTGIITSTSAAATDMTLPTGTDTEGGFSGIYTNMTFEWSVINTGPSLVTVLANTAHTLVGSGAVATGTSARFASRRSAANTFVTYRLS